MKYFIIIFLSFNSFLVPQVFNKDYELLAKYSILKNAIDKGFNSNLADSVFLRGSIEDVHNIIGKSEYKYEVDTINEFRNFQIISIVDKTNFQLHCYNYNVFALDKSAEFGTRYYELNKDNFLDFINNFLYGTNKTNEKLYLINIYNSLYSYLNKCTNEIIFYDEKNKSEFKYLDGKFNFNDLDKPRDYFQNIYCTKNDNGDIVEFYQILYFFDCDGMRVESFLLYKIRV